MMAKEVGREKSEERKGPFSPVAVVRASFFPLSLAIAGILATGVALAASAWGIQWGAVPPAPDALQMAWAYVNVSMIGVWLVLWPAVSIATFARRTGETANGRMGETAKRRVGETASGRIGESASGRMGETAASSASPIRPFTGSPIHLLAAQVLTLLITAIPAFGVAAFLAGATVATIVTAAGLQVATAVLAMAAMAHQRRVGPAVIAGTLAALGVALPVAGYLWSEFYPAAWQGWVGWIPALAATHAAAGGGGTWWVSGTYVAVALGLIGCQAQRKGPLGPR